MGFTPIFLVFRYLGVHFLSFVTISIFTLYLGVSTQTETSDTSSRKKNKRQPKFDLKQKSISLEPTTKSSHDHKFLSHDQSSRLRRTTSAEPMPKIPEVKENFEDKTKKEKKLSRKNTIHEKSEEQRKESEKRQRMLARAKSLNDLNRKVVSGFNPGLSYDSSSNLSASSVSFKNVF